MSLSALKEKQKFDKKLREKIRMPPVMKERKQCDVVLAKDDVLQDYEDSNVCFVDISEDKSDRVSGKFSLEVILKFG